MERSVLSSSLLGSPLTEASLMSQSRAILMPSTLLSLHSVGKRVRTSHESQWPMSSTGGRSVRQGWSCESIDRRHTVCAAVELEQSSPKLESRRPKRIVGRGARLIGTGSAVPSKIISNEHLAALVETNDEWITTRTGIKNRRVLSENESLTQLSAEAASKAMAMAGVAANDIDLIILCTSTPEDVFGGACMIARELGCFKAVAFDLTAACSGFVLGLVTATRFIQGGGFENVLVIGADCLSRYVDWTDRGTCILFGDGCGALLIRAAAAGEEGGLLGFDMKSDGAGSKHLHARVTTAPPSASTYASETPSENGAAATAAPAADAGASPVAPKASPSFIQMTGREVYKFAVSAVPSVVLSALDEAELSPADLDWLLLHQANQRILDAVGQKLGLPKERIISNVANYGNTSAASIPLAMDEAVREGLIKPGDVIATAGFGAGLTWASAIIRWG